MRRLLAIGFVWLASSLAWAILGSTLTVRSGERSGALLHEVHALWGPQLAQAPPTAYGSETHRVRKREQRFDEKEKRYYEVERETDATTERALPLEASDLDATIALDHRKKGLLWFPTYGVSFRGRYEFRNDTAEARSVVVKLPLAKSAVSYARLFMGWRTAVLLVGVAQLLYLVLFSFSFFWQGFTGLAITVGAILTLFVIMQITGKLDWGRALSGASSDLGGTRA